MTYRKTIGFSHSDIKRMLIANTPIIETIEATAAVNII